MGNLNRIFHFAVNNIGNIDDGSIADELEGMGAVNIKTFPSWIYDTMVKPMPVLNGASVERYSIDVESANNSFIDIHILDDEIVYMKVFFLFGVHQIFKIKGSTKKVAVLSEKYFGNPNQMLTQRIRPIVGQDSLTYISDDTALVTCSAAAMAQKEFQIHLYLRGFFDALFG